MGAACVFFMKKSMGDTLQRILTGFAAGVMVAASVWSLIIPAIEQAENMGKWSFVPAAVGFWLGILFLLFPLTRKLPKGFHMIISGGWTNLISVIYYGVALATIMLTF